MRSQLTKIFEMFLGNGKIPGCEHSRRLDCIALDGRFVTGCKKYQFKRVLIGKMYNLF